MRPSVLCVCALLGSQALSAELADRHELSITIDWKLTATDSTLGAWTDGGYGKLRYDTRGAARDATRLAIDYTGQISTELFAHAVLDYIDDADTTTGLTEAYLEWRPLPSGMNRHRFRFGAFYPPLSFENTDLAWDSPYTNSFSASNSWLGEEIRPIGVEWRLGRPIGSPASPQEAGTFAGLFYGNDTAATLLFWRGWSLHNRQTRLNERLPLPALIFPGPGGGPDIVVERQLDPIAEIDDRPGVYFGGEWRYARRAKLSLTYWDNRADPTTFRNRQWSWRTRFWNFSAQISLPGDIGLITQHMRGDTDWLIYVTDDGAMTPLTTLAADEFDTSFVLISKSVGNRHRVSLRRDAFKMWRPGRLNIDRGSARTLAYRYAVNPRLELQLEWLEIESSRDLWPIFYGRAASSDSESQLQLGLRWILFDSTE
jgi:hypothetical protein